MTERLLEEIRRLSTKPILFVINTSADADHTGGNAAIAKPAARRAVQAPPAVNVFAQDNVLLRMSKDGSGVPEAGWPTITFEEAKDFTFNGETIQLFAEKSAHTDGDGVVLFRGSNVISTGNVFRTTGYPMIDVQRGGNIQGEVKALNHILQLAIPGPMQEGGTMVIPGQGRLCDQADVTEYRDTITIIRDRVADLVKKGKSLEEVRAAHLTRDYDGRYSTSEYTGDMFVEAIYRSLK
jgi:glyoxylase-like metal-dependent hydrolase (beta-lactamase superfamily II)